VYHFPAPLTHVVDERHISEYNEKNVKDVCMNMRTQALHKEGRLHSMNNQTPGYVDLHIHSFFSDGTYTPKEILAEAKRSDVGIFAITDHDVLEGSRELKELCRTEGQGIKYISGVEIDSVYKSTNFHILGYCVDLDNKRFKDFAYYVRTCLDNVSIGLITEMEKSVPSVSLAEYLSFTYDRHLGGWAALHYLVAKGLASSLKDGLRFYADYGITFDDFGFPTIPEVCAEVKNAGGYSVIAHPGEVIDTSDIRSFTDTLTDVADFGLDGVECYYPTHSPEITKACVDICRQKNLMITSGSDCHGTFGKTSIGQLCITRDKLDITKLLEKY